MQGEEGAVTVKLLNVEEIKDLAEKKLSSLNKYKRIKMDIICHCLQIYIALSTLSSCLKAQYVTFTWTE